MTVNGLNASFARKNYLERVVPEDEEDHDIKSFTARYKAALHASDQGDLIVELPQGVTIQESNVNSSFPPPPFLLSSLSHLFVSIFTSQIGLGACGQ